MCWRAVGNYTCGRHPIKTYAYCASVPHVGARVEGDPRLWERQPCDSVADVPQTTLIPCVKPECMALSAGWKPATLAKDPEATGKAGGDNAPKVAASTGGDTLTGDRKFAALWIEGADEELHHVCRCYKDGCGCTKYDDDMESAESLRCNDCREMKGKCLVKDAALDSMLANIFAKMSI